MKSDMPHPSIFPCVVDTKEKIIINDISDIDIALNEIQVVISERKIEEEKNYIERLIQAKIIDAALASIDVSKLTDAFKDRLHKMKDDILLTISTISEKMEKPKSV